MGAERIPGMITFSLPLRILALCSPFDLPFAWRMASASSEEVRYEVLFRYRCARVGMLSPRLAVYISVPGAAVGCKAGMSAALTAEMLAGCNWALDFKPLWAAGDTAMACFVDALCCSAATGRCGPRRHAAPPNRRHEVDVITRADQRRKTSSLQTRLRSYRAHTALASYRWTSPCWFLSLELAAGRRKL